MKQITVKVPATSGNMGAGFDILGVALTLYNRITLGIELNGKKAKPEIEIVGEGEGELPEDEENLVFKASNKVFKRLKVTPSSVYLKIENKIPLARGLGSSASVIVGGMKAANILTGNKIEDNDLLRMAVDMEGHPDNAVPALYGGLCLSILSKGKFFFQKDIPFPREVFFVVSVPNFRVETKKARAVLPRQEEKWNGTYRDHLEGLKNVVWHIAEFYRERNEGEKITLIPKDEWFHQPYRKKLVPGMEEVIKAAERVGAYGAVLSGAGPSIIALVEKGDNWEEKGKKIGHAMDIVFARHKNKGKKIKAQHQILEIDRKGCVEI